MKFFSEELYGKSVSANPAIAKKSRRQWEQNEREYFDRYLKNIRSHLPVKLFHFAEEISLMNGVMLFLNYGNFFKTESKWKRKQKPYVAIKVMHPLGKYIYVLEFMEVRRCLLKSNYDERRKWYGEEWAFDEIALMRDKWIRFEVWMFSGTSVLIEFKRFNYFRERVGCSDYYTLPMRWARATK